MTLTVLWRLIRTLLAALGAPACMIARAWRRDERAMRGFVFQLERLKARGRWLRYEGEDDSTVAWRIDRLNWIARDPHKAARHISRHGAGIGRHLYGAMYAPASWTPPLVAQAPLAFPPVHDPLVDIDTC